MSEFNQELFEGKTLSDVFRDIYSNTDSKREQINQFIKKLVVLIKTPEDAAVIGPIIKEFYEVNVKNDEHLVRVAQIAQRIVAIGVKAGSVETLLTEAEKAQLLREVSVEVAEISKQVDDLFDNGSVS